VGRSSSVQWWGDDLVGVVLGQGLLGIEQDEQPGDAVLGIEGIEGVVMQQVTGPFPAGLGVDDAGGSAPAGRGQLESGELLFSP
jgi:hypothetical protein